MIRLKRIVLSTLCFVAALACYVFGIPLGGVVFLILGMAFEGLFWLGILGARGKDSKDESES